MIYTSKGYRTKRMQQVITDKSPFQYLWDYEPATVPIDDSFAKESLKETKAAIAPYKKQVLYFLTGDLKDGQRSNENLLKKDLIVIDYDNLNMNYTSFVSIIREKLQGIAFILYPSVSNYVGQMGMRFRLVIDTSRSYTQQENENLLQNVMDYIGIPADSASKTWAQLMGLPTLNQLSPATLITRQEREAMDVDQFLYEPVPKVEKTVMSAFEGELTHDVAVEMVQAYADRVGGKLQDRNFYLNPYLNIKHAFETREIGWETVQECLTILAMGNEEWERNNIEHFKRDTAPVTNGTPFAKFFGWAVASSVEVDFGDLSDWGTGEISNNTETKPVHIGIELREIEKQATLISDMNARADYMEAAITSLNNHTPSWFWAVPEIKRDAGGVVSKVGYKDGYDHVKMANSLIEKYHLFRFPKLREGAMYSDRRGFWRYFGKNEMKDFAERETLRILEAWGYYDASRIPPTRVYVWQKTYEGQHSDKSPFLESDPALVVFKNGTYDMLTDSMKKNDPKDYILNAHEYELDTSGRPTPHTDALIAGLVGDAALFLKQYIGYLFYRSYAPAQEMVFFKGDGGEGKSTFINFIAKHLIGDENVSAVSPQELSDDKFSRVELLGKNVNLSADIPEQFISDSSVLKRLTGCDRLLVQYKGIQGFFMINYAKMIFSANILPRFRDLSEGFADRLAVIKFINGDQRKEGATFWKNHDMRKVEAEAPAFAHACMKEFIKILDGKKAQFSKPKSVTDATAKWIFDNDHVSEFMEASTVIHINDERGEIAATVHKEYNAFCSDNGYYAKSPQAIRDYLEGVGVPKIRSRHGFNDGGSNQWRYKGLELVISYRYADFD